MKQYIIRKGKLPVDYRTGKTGDAHDPGCWLDEDTAYSIAQVMGEEYAVGFVFTENDPFFFVDLDDCLNKDGKTWTENSQNVVNMLPGAAVEVSQSGKGLHIFGRCTGEIPEHTCKNVVLKFELYTHSRFVALTTRGIIKDDLLDCTALLPDLIKQYFPPREAAKEVKWTTEPVEEWSGPEDDDELINKMLTSRSAASVLGGRASFKELWEGGGPEDRSSADASMAQHLAFWTGSNCERIERIMRRSELVRYKWDREDYLPRTILKAISMQKEFYNDGKKQRPRVGVNADTRIASEIQKRDGYQFLGLEGQMELFKGCVYVQELHRAFTPDGVLIKSEQFNVTYGGYVFQLEDTSAGKVTRKAWDVFTESQGLRWPIAHRTCFRPELESGALIKEEGRVLVNTYVPINTLRLKGEVTPFLVHLNKVLPVEEDREILLAYMAACVQHKGSKFQWAPLLQGAEGNGKTLFTRCVSYALGERYTHLPKAADIDNKFNAWVSGKLFAGVEDIYVAENKGEIIEALKPLITNDRIEIQAKGIDQTTGDNRANFILNSNHKDAIRKTQNDRRFAVFYTAQQNAEEVMRDGMGGSYFPKLYAWLRDGGYAKVNNYLHEYAIPDDLNPAGECHRAPITSSTEEAIKESLGSVEQAILEAVEEERPGFAKGWISSIALGKLLHEIRMERVIPANKRTQLLRNLGYDFHPALKNGRVNDKIMIDGGKKPRLYIKADHLYANLTRATEVARAYQEAQTASSSASSVFKKI